MQASKSTKRKTPAGGSGKHTSYRDIVRQIEVHILSGQKNKNTPVIIIDKVGHIVLWNQASAALFGYSADEVVGQDFNIVIPEEYHSLNKYRMRLMLQTGEARFPETPIELAVRRKDGTDVIGEFQPAMVNTKKGMFFSVVVRDITGQRPGRSKKGGDAGTGRGRRKELETLVSTAGKLLNGDFAVYQKASGDFFYCEAGWNVPDGFRIMEKRAGILCHDLMRRNRRRVTLVTDLDSTGFAQSDPAIRQNRLKTVIACPVRNGRKAIGVLGVYYHSDVHPDENAVQILSICGQALEAREAHLQAAGQLEKNGRKLEIAETNIRRLSRQILLYREEERKSISATLHDEVGAMVVSLSSGLTLAEEEIKDGNLDDAVMQILQVKDKLDSAVENLKKMAVDLRPPDLGIIGLKGVLQEYISDIEEQTKVRICFKFDLDGIDINDTIATAIYRFFQEGINNSIKHSGAETITVMLGATGGRVNIDVVDDGRGFDCEEFSKGAISTKIGLWGMKMRTQALGGTFSIVSKIGGGTKIHIEIPF